MTEVYVNQTKIQAPKNEIQFPHRSDGSELVPAEVQANQRQDEEDQTTWTAGVVIPGSTMDDEGLINNFAVEPKVYLAEYPSIHQQRRYIYWGIAATVLIVSLVLLSGWVS